MPVEREVIYILADQQLGSTYSSKKPPLTVRAGAGASMTAPGLFYKGDFNQATQIEADRLIAKIT